MVLGSVYGNFRLKYPDVYLVGYMSVKAAENMIGSGDNLFDIWLDKKEGIFGEVDVYNRQKGSQGHISFAHRDGVITPLSNFRLSSALFMEALETLGWWCEKHGYGYAMPNNNQDREAWPLMKRFFERWGKK